MKADKGFIMLEFLAGMLLLCVLLTALLKISGNFILISSKSRDLHEAWKYADKNISDDCSSGKFSVKVLHRTEDGIKIKEVQVWENETIICNSVYMEK